MQVNFRFIQNNRTIIFYSAVHQQCFKNSKGFKSGGKILYIKDLIGVLSLITQAGTLIFNNIPADNR